MAQKKNINSLITIILIMVIVVCTIIIFGLYMNGRWKRMRDIRRRADAQTIIKAIDIYYLNEGQLPDNISDQDWDSTYNSENDNQNFLKELQDKGILSYIFDPKNSEEYQYRYHKFEAGEYGCNRPFAILQVKKFESGFSEIGGGACPDKNFVTEAPQGFTYQWFE